MMVLSAAVVTANRIAEGSSSSMPGVPCVSHAAASMKVTNSSAESNATCSTALDGNQWLNSLTIDGYVIRFRKLRKAVGGEVIRTVDYPFATREKHVRRSGGTCR